jgi:hypothetical protein
MGEPRFQAVSYDPDGQPVRIWIGSKKSCDRFVADEQRDGLGVSVTEAAQDLTWDQLRDQVWPDKFAGTGKRVRLW